MLAMTLTTAFVLSLMFAARADAGEGPAPWETQLPRIAEAIADECQSASLPGGGPEWCAAVMVVLAHQESRFDVEAEHDHHQGLGLYGVHHATLGRRVSDDAAGQTREALGLLEQSFAACASQPLDERLAWYASGYCGERLSLSRYRLHLAARVLRSALAP